MPMTGSHHERMIEKLRRRGICQEAEAIRAHEVADAIWEALYAKVQRWTQVLICPSATRTQRQEPLRLSLDPIIHGRDGHSSGMASIF